MPNLSAVSHTVFYHRHVFIIKCSYGPGQSSKLIPLSFANQSLARRSNLDSPSLLISLPRHTILLLTYLITTSTTALIPTRSCVPLRSSGTLLVKSASLGNWSSTGRAQLPQHRQELKPTNVTMCIRVIEKYAVCGCIYHIHGVDACAAYGQHAVEDKEVLVGYACAVHSK